MTNRIKRIFKKHWTLIKNNTLLNHIFASLPVIAYKANPSLTFLISASFLSLKGISNVVDTLVMFVSSLFEFVY